MSRKKVSALPRGNYYTDTGNYYTGATQTVLFAGKSFYIYLLMTAHLETESIGPSIQKFVKSP